MTGCNWIWDRVYYAGMEKLGREKRDILAKRVSAGREDQEKAKEQFQTTLQAFQQLTGFDGGELEKVYNKLNREPERSESRAKQVRDRIDGIERVARDLFREWDQEIDKMSSADLKAKSRVLRDDTEDRYKQLIAKMRQAESKMDPVLAAFRDQVLFPQAQPERARDPVARRHGARDRRRRSGVGQRHRGFDRRSRIRLWLRCRANSSKEQPSGTAVD
ncbi:MAG: DUF2959 family protein [Bryobacterales bacterium]